MILDEQTMLWDSLEFFNNHATDIPLVQELETLERERIASALHDTDNNRSRAAKALGIGRTLLIHKIKKYNL